MLKGRSACGDRGCTGVIRPQFSADGRIQSIYPMQRGGVQRILRLVPSF